MTMITLKFTLKRDTIFGRGDGVAGWVDAEVEHDYYGLPFLRGRALKGMLVYECADVLFALRLQNQAIDEWQAAAGFLFGWSGQAFEQEAQLEIGDARLPDELRQAIAYQISLDNSKAGQLRHDVLNGLTTIRRQTAVDVDAVAKEKSLRAIRLIRRDTEFTAPLHFNCPLDQVPDKAKGLLAACVQGFRRGGTSRNRGPGLLEADLWQNDQRLDWFAKFKIKKAVKG